eukprot:TRINITY_DN34327_c0_g1_i1.p1 TRINITY_DN34327_c0_g1~~TRINITY_DN34327_c0_g1_i1.p1  ORF type:complete len:253 (-),score=96.21 TRINITY_DN34327_c0_g1_i1:454-1212(-)
MAADEPQPVQDNLPYELLMQKGDKLDTELVEKDVVDDEVPSEDASTKASSSPKAASDFSTSAPSSPASEAPSKEYAMKPVAKLDPAEGPTKKTVVFLRQVAVQDSQPDEKVAALLEQTRELSTLTFGEDCLRTITKKQGWKLTLLASEDMETLCGFLVGKVISGTFSIAKLAVPTKFRGRGFGTLMVDDCCKHAKKQNDLYEVGLSSLASSISFYKRLGFKGLPAIKVETDVPGQLYMEKKLRGRPRKERKP